MARYDHIDFVPPQGVREACMRGVALHEQGVTGDGIDDDTVAWARRLARGERVTAAKARKMARFFGRNQRFAAEPKDSPAWASWQLWGGHAGDAWSEKLVAQMDAADEASTAASKAAQAPAATPAGPQEWYRARVPLLVEHNAKTGGAAVYFVLFGGASDESPTHDVLVAPGVTLTFYADGRLFALDVDDARRLLGDEFVASATDPALQCE